MPLSDKIIVRRGTQDTTAKTQRPASCSTVQKMYLILNLIDVHFQHILLNFNKLLSQRHDPDEPLSDIREAFYCQNCHFKTFLVFLPC
jgi:hypothetical protein